MFIKLHYADKSDPIWINTDNIITIDTFGNGQSMLTLTHSIFNKPYGNTFVCYESPDDILGLMKGYAPKPRSPWAE